MPVRPRWVTPVTLALSLAGLGVSSYLSVVHYTEPTALSCPDTGVVNFLKVTTSAQSTVGPVPVGSVSVRADRAVAWASDREEIDG